MGLSRIFYHVTTFAWDFRYRLRGDYSQFGEQEFLKKHLPSDLSEVVFIDIGAHTPVKCSNSYFLYQAGSSGIAVDAISSFAPHWNAWRSRDLFLNRVVVGTDYEGEDYVDFFRASRAQELLSTASLDREVELSQLGTKFDVERIRVLNIVSLLRMFKDLFSKAPDLVLVDVEGMDKVLIESIDGCSDENMLPNFIFFEQLDSHVQGIKLTNYSLLAEFVPVDRSHARSLLFQKTSSKLHR